MLKELITVGLVVTFVLRFIGHWRTRVLISLLERFVVARILPENASFAYDSGCVSIVLRLTGGRAITLIASGIQIRLFPLRIRLSVLKLWMACSTADLQAPAPALGRAESEIKGARIRGPGSSFVKSVVAQVRVALEITQITLAGEFQPTPALELAPSSSPWVDIEHVIEPWKAGVQVNAFSAILSSQLTVDAETVTVNQGDTVVEMRSVRVTRVGGECTISLDSLAARVVLQDLAKTILCYVRFLHERADRGGTVEIYGAPAITSWHLALKDPISLYLSDPGFIGAAIVSCGIGVKVSVSLNTPCASCNSWDPIRVPYLTYIWKARLHNISIDGELTEREQTPPLPELITLLREHLKRGYGTKMPILRLRGALEVAAVYDRWPKALDSYVDAARPSVDGKSSLGKYRQSISAHAAEEIELYGSYLASGTDLYLWWLYFTQLYKCYRLNKKSYAERERLFAEAQARCQANREVISLNVTADWFNQERQEQKLKCVESFLTTWEISRLLTPSVISISFSKVKIVLVPVPEMHIARPRGAAATLRDFTELRNSVPAAQKASPDLHAAEAESDSCSVCLVTLQNICIFSSDAVEGSRISVGHFRASGRKRQGAQAFEEINQRFWLRGARPLNPNQLKTTIRGADVDLFVPSDFSRAELVVGEVRMRSNAQSLAFLGQSAWSAITLIFASYFLRERSSAFRQILQRGGLDQNIGLIIKRADLSIGPDTTLQAQGLHIVKEKATNNYYCRCDVLSAWTRRKRILNVRKIEVWYATTACLEATPGGRVDLTNGEDRALTSVYTDHLIPAVADQDANANAEPPLLDALYYTTPCDVEVKMLSIKVYSAVGEVSDNNTICQTVVAAYYSIYRLVILFASPPRIVQRVYSMVTKRLRPAFSPMTLQRIDIGSLSLSCGMADPYPAPPPNRRHQSCPAILRAKNCGLAPPLSEVKETSVDVAEVPNEILAALLGSDMISNPLILRELKSVIQSLVSKLKGSRVSLRTPSASEDKGGGRTSLKNYADEVMLPILTTCRLGTEGLRQCCCNNVVVELNWQLQLEKPQLINIGIDCRNLRVTSRDDTLAQITDLESKLTPFGLNSAQIGCIKLSSDSSMIVDEGMLSWSLDLLKQAVDTAQALFPTAAVAEQIPATFSEMIDAGADEYGSDSPTNKISLISVDDAASDHSLTDNSDCLTYISSTNKSSPWLAIGEVHLQLWHNALTFTSPFPLEVRKKASELSLDLRGTCALKIFGTTALKLRAPCQINLNFASLMPSVKFKLRCLEIHAIPSVMAVCYHFVNRVLHRGRRLLSAVLRVHPTTAALFADKAHPSVAPTAEALRFEEIELEQIMIRISHYLTVSCKSVNYLHDVALTIGSIRALQTITDPLCSHLACLHSNISDIRVSQSEQGEGSRVTINAFVLHFTPTILAACLHHNVLAFIHLANVVKRFTPSPGAEHHQPEQRDTGWLQSFLKRVSSIQLATFTAHLLETAFLTTRNGPVPPPARKWLLGCAANAVSPCLDAAQAEGQRVRLEAISASIERHVDCTFLTFLERDLSTPIPWHRTSPFQSSAYGFILEAKKVQVQKNFLNSLEELLPEQPLLTVSFPDLLLRSRGSTNSLGRLDFEASVAYNRIALSVHKVLAHLTRRQTVRLAELMTKTLEMAAKLGNYFAAKASERDERTFDEEGGKCMTPTLVDSESDPAAYRLVSTSSRGGGEDYARSVRSALMPDSFAESTVPGVPIKEMTLTFAQGSVAFMCGEVQLLRILISRLLLSRSVKLGSSQDRTKITTCINMSDLMLMTCSPLMAEISNSSRGPQQNDASASMTPALTPLLAPLTDHDPIFTLVMTHQKNRSQKRMKSVGRRKRFISSIMGGGHKGAGISASGDKSKRLFEHMEVERINRQLECCHKYENIDVRLAPVEIKMAQKLLVSIHDYFCGDTTGVSDENEGEGSTPNTDLLESLKAVEQQILKTTQLVPSGATEDLQDLTTTEDYSKSTRVMTTATAATASTVLVAQIKIHPIKLLLSYQGLININECQVSLNPVIMTNVEAAQIDAVLKRLAYHIMTAAFAKALSFRVKNIVPGRKRPERKREKFAIARLMPKKRTADDMLAYILDEHKKRKAKWESP